MFIVDGDPDVRALMQRAAASVSLAVEACARGAEALTLIEAQRPGCLVLDLTPPDADGFALIAALRARGVVLPIIVLSGRADVALAVRALRAGVFDFLEKPVSAQVLLERVQAAIDLDRQRRAGARRLHDFTCRVDRLTPREREVMALVIEGRSSRDIAATLALSPKTVESHRARLMAKTGVASLAELIRLGLLASLGGDALAVSSAAAYASPPQGGARC